MGAVTRSFFSYSPRTARYSIITEPGRWSRSIFNSRSCCAVETDWLADFLRDRPGYVVFDGRIDFAEFGGQGGADGKYEVRSAEYGLRTTEYGVRTTDYGVRSTECGVRSTEYGVRSGKAEWESGRKRRGTRGVANDSNLKSAVLILPIRLRTPYCRPRDPTAAVGHSRIFRAWRPEPLSHSPRST